MNKKQNIPLYNVIIFVLFLAFSERCFSQEDDTQKLNYRSNLFGIGKINVYDTYLSPLNYTGTSLSFMQENMKMTGLGDGNIAVQQLFNIEFSSSENATGNATNYTGFMEYSYGLFYRFTPLPELKIFAGSQADGLIGFIYNTRNGNNPATAKAHLNLTLSAATSYNFKVKSQPLRVRYQISSPFAGIMFSPHYGQSYYEISLGNDDHLANFSSYHNQIILRNNFSLEIPLSFMTLRLMYINSVYETRIYNIETRIHNNSFMIGFTREFFNVSGKKPVKGNYNHVF